MTRYIYGLLLFLVCLTGEVTGQTVIAAYDVTVGRTADSVRVDADLVLSGKQSVKGNRLLMLMPRLVAGNDSCDLPVVFVLGRRPYYMYIRGDNPVQTGPGDVVLRAKDLRRFSPYRYRQTLPYKPWMDRATLKLINVESDCCGDMGPEDTWVAATPNAIIRRTLRQDTILRGEIKGTAYVDFVLDKTDIRPDYHDNPAQLGKIRASIDSVRNNKAATLTGMTIKGYASPEGPYWHNADLARERTKSLSRYISKELGVPDSLISAYYEPEDWAGFEHFVENATAQQLPHRSEILELIRSQLPPDERERRIRTVYKDEFDYILEHCMPYLRHTDYTIDYIWRRRLYQPGRTDTLYRMPAAMAPVRFPDYVSYRRFKPVWALKTNLLFDLALAVNVEAEMAFGRNDQWSVMAEYWTPWYVWHHNSRAYELQTVGVELRRWQRDCRRCLMPLTGTFYGVYAMIGKYDFEWNSVGDQGELFSLGLSGGWAWPIARRLNFELSGSLGVAFGPRRHYHGEFGDTHLIWKYNASTFYAGPTKLKCSLVWLLGNKAEKGGRP